MIQVTAGEKSVSESSYRAIIVRAHKAQDGDQEVKHDIDSAIRWDYQHICPMLPQQLRILFLFSPAEAQERFLFLGWVISLNYPERIFGVIYELSWEHTKHPKIPLLCLTLTCHLPGVNKHLSDCLFFALVVKKSLCLHVVKLEHFLSLRSKHFLNSLFSWLDFLRRFQ